jgi:internalin A
LDISHNLLKNLPNLRQMGRLNHLNCAYNQLENLDFLTKPPLPPFLEGATFMSEGTEMYSFKSLDCSHNPIQQIEALRDLTSLQELDCSYTFIADLSPLYELNDLYKVTLLGVPISEEQRAIFHQFLPNCQLIC